MYSIFLEGISNWSAYFVIRWVEQKLLKIEWFENNGESEWN